MPGDPLFDTLFRPTTAHAGLASAAPVQVPGTRTRAGNSMGRSRAALIEGARRSVEASGTKITMGQVAATGGVSKATLYNHFRTREAVLHALLQDQVRALVELCSGLQLVDALTTAADALSRHPLLRALADREPATLAALARVDVRADGWAKAHAALAEALSAQTLGGADFVLRWLASFMTSPASPDAIASDVDVLLAGLPPLTAGAPVAQNWAARPA